MTEKKGLKVLQVASSLLDIGGIEKQVILLSKGLRDRGHEVHIACWPGTWVWEQAEANGLVTVPVRVRYQQDWKAFPTYLRLLRKGKYDIVNVHFSPDFIIVGLAAKLTKTKGLVLTRRLCFSWRSFNRWLYDGLLYRRFIAISEAVRQALISSGISRSKVVTVHNGILSHSEPVKPAPLRKELGLEQDTFLIGVMARLTPEKGHRYLIDAMRDLDQRVICIIAGSGPDGDSLVEYVQKANMTNRVKFLGWRMDSDAVTAALDVLVHPCIWEEAFGNSIIEAMAVGKPVIATNTAGPAELIDDGATGFLVPKADPKALAKAISKLIDDPELKRRMGEEALKKQQAEFTIARVAGDLEKAYMDLVNE